MEFSTSRANGFWVKRGKVKDTGPFIIFIQEHSGEAVEA
jgi:hypothetical protein